MNKKTERTLRSFIRWKEENAHHLPLNSAFWDIRILPKKQIHGIKDDFVELGKYNATMERGIPFYKPYSKLVIWNLNG